MDCNHPEPICSFSIGDAVALTNIARESASVRHSLAKAPAASWQCRGDAISIWATHEGFAIYRWSMFLHKPDNVEDASYLRPVDGAFRAWVDAFDLFDA